MKRILALLLFGFLVSIPTVSQTEEPPAAFQPAPEDSPILAGQKAALRLFVTYNTVLERAKICRPNTPDLNAALTAYQQRNGNTVAQMVKVIRGIPGNGPELQKAVNEEIARRLAKEADCADFSQAVQDGDLDLYKGPGLINDYRLMRQIK